MTDIVERLRAEAALSCEWPYPLLLDAIDEIERLRAALDDAQGLLTEAGY